jgi:hypothetical protein
MTRRRAVGSIRTILIMRQGEANKVSVYIEMKLRGPLEIQISKQDKARTNYACC